LDYILREDWTLHEKALKIQFSAVSYNRLKNGVTQQQKDSKIEKHNGEKS